jgi:hypothetical protein
MVTGCGFCVLICDRVINYFPGNASPTEFDLIPDLNAGDDGDISLIFLDNGVTYITRWRIPGSMPTR